MDKFAYIIGLVENLSNVFNKPIRVSYYDTYCIIYVFTDSVSPSRLEYSAIDRMFKTNDEICNICYENINHNDVACFHCGNIICNMCFINLICVNYSTGIYACIYCKHIHKVINTINEAEKHILEILHYLNFKDERIELIMKTMREKYPLLFTIFYFI
jgi:hypothetical protein